MAAWIEERLDRNGEEGGMTIVEVLIAVLILAMASMATFGVLASAVRNDQRAKSTQVAIDAAQEQLEKLHSLSYDELAMTKTPPHQTSPQNPDHRVVNGSFALQRNPQGEYATLVVNGESLYGGSGSEENKTIKGGVVTPGPIPFASGNVTGELYRYVVWRDDPSCKESTEAAEDYCPGNQDFKQIVVAVKLDNGVVQKAERGYYEVQSEAIDPSTLTESTAGNTEKAHTGTAVTAQQLYLTDTPCASTGSTERQTIEADHLVHNTLGACANGPQTGTKAGAPDALLLGAPPDPAPLDESNPIHYDYSSDVEPVTPSPETDRGVQIVRDDTSGCHFTPTGTVHPQAQTHRWVTDRLAEDFSMKGKVTLEFYTRALSDGSYHGTLCVYLFKRHETGSVESPSWTDSILKNSATKNAYWTYTPQGNGYWPRSEWTRVRLPMEFAGPETISKDDRLGLALSVDPGNTEAEAIPIAYDHPKYPTRIEVDTTTPIEGS